VSSRPSPLVESLTPAPIAVETIADRLTNLAGLASWRRLPVLRPTISLASPIGHGATSKRLAALESEWEAASAGATLVHFDLRADNIPAHRRPGWLVVDWPHASLGRMDGVLRSCEHRDAGRTKAVGDLRFASPRPPAPSEKSPRCWPRWPVLRPPIAAAVTAGPATHGRFSVTRGSRLRAADATNRLAVAASDEVAQDMARRLAVSCYTSNTAPRSLAR